MKRLSFLAQFIALFVVASGVFGTDARSQGVYEQLKSIEALSAAAPAPMSTDPREICSLAGNERSCRIHYLTDRFTIAWRGTVPVHDGGVVEILVRGDDGALCSDIHEVNDYSRCFALNAAK